MNPQSVARKQVEFDAAPLALDEAVKATVKREVLKKLDHIQQLARQKDFAEIERLLQSGYV